jgi:uncharacterized protein (TIGR02453 family)
MIFNGFSKQGIAFLNTLKDNNTKDWFEEHRYLWEEYILQPNISFVQDMGEMLQILVPNIHFKAKVSGSLFKIYRDIRFSKDKTPMKSNIGILFWQGPNHRMQSSSFYLQYNLSEYMIASGIRNFKPELLKTYREYMKNESKRIELHKILHTLRLKKYIIPEPKYKRVPSGFNKNEQHIYLALYNAMYAYKIFQLDEIFYTKELIDKLFQMYQDMFELHQFVYNMTNFQIEY